MKAFTLNSSSLTLLALCTAISALHVKPRAQCYDNLLINVRGTGEAPFTFFATKPMITAISAALPNTGIYETEYPANFDISQKSTLVGVESITRTIQEGLKNCPGQKYAIIGYSQGATVTTRLLQKFAPDSPEGQAISGVLLMGNPYHLPKKPGNIDEYGSWLTAGASGILLLTSNFRIPDSWYDSGKVMDICFTNDSICNGLNAAQLDLLGLHLGDLFNLEELLKSGRVKIEDLVTSSHLYYPGSQSVQERGRDFVLSKLQ